jgi:hypothetical protein
MHPERITAIISQNGNVYEEGLSDGWNPIRAYWQDSSRANREALGQFLTPQATRWQYIHGVVNESAVSPDGIALDNFYLGRHGADEVQLDPVRRLQKQRRTLSHLPAVFSHTAAAVACGTGQERPILPAGRSSSLQA